MSYRGVLLFLYFFSLAAVAYADTQNSSSTIDLAQQIMRDETPLGSRGQMLLSYADMVERVRDSVVTILVTHPKASPPEAEENGSISPDSSRRFSHEDEDANEQKKNGSGVAFSDNLIVTNAHVVRDAEKMYIRLRGQENDIPAILVGIDHATDIALLKVDDAPLKRATLGNSAVIRPGDVALVIGSPFGLEQTVTLGIISATGRGTLGLIAGGLEDFIQTDAAINPGNSGGPLMDGLGRVIGIATARHWGESIGFAVPINLVLKVASDLNRHGWVVRGYLGVSMMDVSPKLIKELQLPPKSMGVVIKTVEMDEAGAASGFMPGDLVKEVNGRRVENSARFRLSLASQQPGDTATFKILRQGKETTLQAKLGDPPELKAARAKAEKEPSTAEWLPGLHVAQVDREWRFKLKLAPQVSGLIVTQPFETQDGKVKLAVGDQILLINGRKAADLAAARSLLDGLKTSVLLLKIRSAGEERFAAVPRTK
jgi:S1-C subfamily serine protease